jgi:hypothetical protein
MSKPTTPRSREATASSAISSESVRSRIAQTIWRRVMRWAFSARSKPRETASTTCSSVMPRAVENTGA